VLGQAEVQGWTAVRSTRRRKKLFRECERTNLAMGSRHLRLHKSENGEVRAVGTQTLTKSSGSQGLSETREQRDWGSVQEG